MSQQQGNRHLLFRWWGNQTIRVKYTSVKTLQDLLLKLSTITSVKPSNLKLLKNGKIIKDKNSTLISQLNIQEGDKLHVLTKQPVQSITFNLHNASSFEPSQMPYKKNQPKSIAKPSLSEILRQQGINDQAIIEKIINFAEKDEQVCIALAREGVVEGSFFYSQPVFDQIFSNIIKSDVLGPHKMRILSQGKLWIQILTNIFGNIPGMSQQTLLTPKRLKMAINQLYECEQSLTKFQQKELLQSMQKRTDYDLVALLQSKYPATKQIIVQAVQISQNNCQTVITILQNLIKNHHHYEFQLKPKPQDQSDQQPCLYQWLSSLHKTVKIKLAVSPKYIDLHTLSLKHCCPPLYQLFICHRPYIDKLVFKMRPSPRLSKR